MHSMHQVRTVHNGTLNQQHLQQQQQQQQQDIGSSGQQSQQHSEQQKQQLNMTVLESLEPVQPAQQQQQQQQQAQQQQPVLSILDPVQQTMLQQQQQQTVIHHLVPAPAPLLHQLQPSNRQLIEQQQQHELEQQQQQQQEQQQQQQQVVGDQDASSMTLTGGPQSQAGHQRQRPNQIEGIVAEGGGPIVQWLLDNYEIADGESLPRSTVYNHYLAHCRQLRMSSVNAASFGKLIRSVFVGLKTRRLGTRGHSKYHYFGVRAKQHVRLDWLHEASEGRAGCSSAGMMRDSNDTNSNGSDGNCGSESDSTGNCSGRLSGSMSGHNHHHHHLNGNNSTNNSKRLKRTANNAMVPDDYAHLHQTTIEHGTNLDDLDQHHLHHGLHINQQQPQQQIYNHNEHNATNGMYLAYPMNGYDKQDSFASGEGELGAQWATPSQYDLSSFRNHLGPNKSSLVYEAWPEREPGLLERQLDQVMQAADKRGASRLSQAASKSSRLNPDLASLVEPFEDQYKFYYKRMVELLGELQSNDIEHLWSEFWHPPSTRPVGEAVHWTTDDLNQQQQQHEQQTLAYQDGQQQTQSHLNQQLNNALTFEQLYELTSQQPMIERINQIDCKLHSAIESFLVVDMLNPLPRPLVQHIRAFARNICAWTESAIKDYHPSFVANKIKSTRAFEHALRRYTSINHLSTASRAVWAKRSALVQMSIDLSRLDLRDIEHQVASLMNQEKFVAPDAIDGGEICRTGSHDNHNLLQSADMHQQQQPTGQNGDVSTVLVMQSPSDAPEQTTTPTSVHNANDNIENNYASHHHGHTNRHTADESNTDGRPQQPTANNNNNFAAHINDFSPMQPAQLVQNFLHLLEDPYPANAWPDWCRTLVESRVTGQSCDEARNFILKWNFYISLILRELTLRSAPSLGSFQLIRLLFDEYMYYLVVSRLAQGQHKTSSQLLRPSAKFGNI